MIMREQHLLVAIGSLQLTRRRPSLVSLKGETNQRHQHIAIPGSIQPHRHPRRCRHHPDGRRFAEVFFEPPDHPHRQVQVSLPSGMKMDDLPVG